MKDKTNWFIKIMRFFRDFMESYLPAILLFALFVIFVLQIFMRYVLRMPLTWSFELTLFFYVYVVLLGSCSALRTDEHVVFSMIYDSANKRVQAWMRIITTVLIVVVFVIAMPSVIYYSWFINTASLKRTTVLKIPYKYMYLAFLYMLWASGIMKIVESINDIKMLIKKEIPVDGNENMEEVKE
jgi:TRAP-type C4-dicarboxylate transport system permease small subunit